jgi:hypothetical protein
MDAWMDELMKKQTDRWMDGDTHKHVNGWMNKWMHAYLEDAIQGVEGQPSKGGQGVLLVVLVVDVVQHPAPPNATLMKLVVKLMNWSYIFQKHSW